MSVVVLAGGLSAERDVSLRSGRRLAESLRAEGVEVSVLDLDAALLPSLQADPPSVVIPLVHGAAGEDGSLADVLDALLGVSMEKVLDAMRLPDPICDALLGNAGRYHPFLELAQSSETNQGELIAEQAGMLGLTADQFNRAQLQAQSFAETMEL